MGKPYSEDLRRNVVHAIESGHTYEEAAELYGVSISSVSRFLTRWRSSGSVSPEQFGGYKGYALEQYRDRITRWLGAQPDVTLAELQARLRRRIWQSAKPRSSATFAIWASLLKKKACTRPNKTGRT
jgi:transposase